LNRSENLTLLQMDGFITKEMLDEALKIGKKACKEIYEVQKKALKDQYEGVKK